MNVDLFKEILISKTSSVLSWNEDDDSNAEATYLNAEFGPQDYNNVFDLYVSFFDDGVSIIRFVLYGVDKNESALKLVNNFNKEVLFLNGYLLEKNNHYNFFIRTAIHNKSEDDAADYVVDMIDYITSDNVKPYLTPIDIIAG